MTLLTTKGHAGLQYLRLAAGLVGGLLLVLSLLSRLVFPPHELTLRLRALDSSGPGIKVFYLTGTGGFIEEQSSYLVQGVRSEGGLYSYYLSARTADPVQSLRFDPDAKEGQLTLETLSLETKSGKAVMTAQDLLNSRISMADLEQDGELRASPEANGSPRLHLRISGPDAQFILTVPPQLVGPEASRWSKRFKRLSTPAATLGGLLLLLLALSDQVLRGSKKVWRGLRIVSAQVSRSSPIRMRPGGLLVLASLAIYFVVYVALALHNSSIGAWTDRYGYPFQDPGIEFGEPLPIRSDEWHVYTPWLLNQIETGFRTDNPNIGPPGTPLVTALPTLHPTLLAQPQFWGYFLFDNERGFSWHWGFKAVSLLGSMFLLLLALTRGHTVASLCGALAIFGSPIVQWWYGSWLEELITGLSVALLAAYVWSRATRPWQIHTAALVAALAGMHVVLHPYLPGVVAVTLVGVLATGALVWESVRAGHFGVRRPQRGFALLAGMALLLALFASYLYTAGGAVDTLLNTEYPGQRRILHSSIPLQEYQIGFFEYLRNQYHHPHPEFNAPEAARFIPLIPILVWIAAVPGRKIRFGAVFWVLFGYSVVAVTWMSAPLPEALRSAMGAMGLKYVLPHRLYGSLCVATWWMLVLAYARIAQQGGIGWRWTATTVAMALMLVGWSWTQVQSLSPLFYDLTRLGLGLAAVGLLTLAVCRSMRLPLILGTLICAWHSLQITPISTGFSRILDKDIFLHTTRLDPKGQEKWVVFEDVDFAQALRANGHQVLNGMFFVPRLDLIRVFDPQEQFKSIWNNYGSVNISASPGLTKASFVQHFPNSYTMTIDPCEPALKSTGATRIVFKSRQTASDYPCLKEVESFEPISVFVYRFANPGQ